MVHNDELILFLKMSRCEPRYFFDACEIKVSDWLTIDYTQYILQSNNFGEKTAQRNVN